MSGEDLHNRYCQHNHTDGCGFFSEPRPHQRGKWDIKAEELEAMAVRAGVTVEVILHVHDTVRDILARGEFRQGI